MSSLVIFATFDASLAEAWERQLPPRRPALRLDSRRWGPGTAPGFSAVVVLDAAAEHSLPAALASCPTIYVGEPRSVPFEQARLAGRARIYLSYEDSASRLRELLPLLEELAEKQSLVELLTEKARRPEPIRPAPRPTVHDVAGGVATERGDVPHVDARARRRHLAVAGNAVTSSRADLACAVQSDAGLSTAAPSAMFVIRTLVSRWPG